LQFQKNMMTPKRLILGALTLIVVLLIGNSLITSWSQPQISSRLQLYQTDLLLRASQLQAAEPADLTAARTALVGEDPIATALEQYQTVRQSAATSLKRFYTQLEQLNAPPIVLSPTANSSPVSEAGTQAAAVQASIAQQQTLIHQLDLRIGLLQTQENATASALNTWAQIESPAATTADVSGTSAESDQDLAQTAAVLRGLWSNSPQLLPDAEETIQQNLDGWFRDIALAQLYQLQQRSDALSALQAAAQQAARQTFVKLTLIGIAPVVGCLLGVGVLVFLLIQRFTQGKQAILALNESYRWETPWDWETVWQVFVVGFFFVGQIALPLLLAQLGSMGISFAAFGVRSKATFSLTYYLLLAGSGLLVLYLSIKPWLPLPDGWFRLRGRGSWLVWGISGYLVALPLMLGVSLVNQQIWQGQGGSNPLLQLVLEEGDRVSLAIFLFTAAVAAPVFEETLFRGFLLPSLTRYLPVWGAIALSSLLFAVAHLSLSEVLPLTVLGCVLGFVYTRSRNLLSSMLLHSLWNSVTMIGLFILGRGTA
jgi:hypothetical protein